MTYPEWPYNPMPPVPLAPVPGAAPFDLMRDQLATAADGRLWSDIALWKNIVFTTDQSTSILVWEPTRKAFLSFGVSSGNPVGLWSRNGRQWFTIVNMQNGAGLNPALKSSDHNGAGVVVVGGTPGSSSTQKFRRSTDGGLTWAIQNSTVNNGNGVQSVRYVPWLSLWIAGHVGGQVETSPDGITWTNRTAPNAFIRSEIAFTTASGIVVMGNATSNTVITSPDGVNWTSRNVGGSGSDTARVMWSAKHGKFFACANTGGFQVSSSMDGITWSQAGLTLPVPGLGVIDMVEHGRAIIAITLTDGLMAAHYSLDGCQSWAFLNTLDVNTFQSMAIAAHTSQLIMTDGTGIHYCSLAGGI